MWSHGLGLQPTRGAGGEQGQAHRGEDGGAHGPRTEAERQPVGAVGEQQDRRDRDEGVAGSGPHLLSGPLDDPALDPLRELVAALGVRPEHHVIRPIVRRGRADELAIGLAAAAEDIPSELTITADGAFRGSFAPTVRDGQLDLDLLLTRTALPLSIPATTLMELARGRPAGGASILGIRCA